MNNHHLDVVFSRLVYTIGNRLAWQARDGPQDLGEGCKMPPTSTGHATVFGGDEELGSPWGGRSGTVVDAGESYQALQRLTTGCCWAWGRRAPTPTIRITRLRSFGTQPLKILAHEGYPRGGTAYQSVGAGATRPLGEARAAEPRGPNRSEFSTPSPGGRPISYTMIYYTMTWFNWYDLI